MGIPEITVHHITQVLLAAVCPAIPEPSFHITVVLPSLSSMSVAQASAGSRI